MQRLTGVVVNDGALLPWFARNYAAAVDVADVGPRGHWGIGFHGNGELLAKKAPLGGAQTPTSVLAGLRARHAVLSADSAPGPRRTVEDAQPLRYRDWLCAASGTHSLDDGFVSRVQAVSTVSDFAQRRGATAEEALLMVFVDALYRGHARDTRKLPVATLREAVAEGTERLRELLRSAVPDLAILLFAHEHLFAVPLGRPMCAARFGPSEHARLERSPDARRAEHLRAVVVSDRQTGAARWEVLRSAVSVGADCDLSPFEA